MSKNNNNTNPAKQATITNEQAKKQLDKTHLFLIIFAAVALVGILASIIAAVAVSASKKSLDYMNGNISKYVIVPESLYSSYDVEINIPEVTDFDVKDEIVKVLCANKIEPDTPVINLPNITVSAGDVVNIYYRGYTEEDGKKNYFDGGCNFDSTIASLEIGSGSFIPGFEYNLIGKNQKDYATMTKITSGATMPGDVIKLTYSVRYADGTLALSQTSIIDLSDPNLDENWGEGFSAYFNDLKGKTIGTTFATGGDSDPKLEVGTVKTGDGIEEGAKDTYLDMTVNAIYRISEGEKLEVEAYFPVGYQSEDLAGKTAKFEVYIKTVQDYSVPELNDEFITDTLKLTADDLADCSGDTLVEKYEDYVRKTLVEEYDAEVRSVIEEKFWTDVIAGATFKKLPESDVEKAYNEAVEDIYTSYESGYSSYYSSVDAFARAYLGLSSSDDWQAALRENAEYAIKQKLVFYYILREENLIPNDTQYNEIYDEIYGDYLQSYLDYYGITEDDEDYEDNLRAAKDTINSQFNEEYWYENVLYEFFMDAIVKNANKI